MTDTITVTVTEPAPILVTVVSTDPPTVTAVVQETAPIVAQVTGYAGPPGPTGPAGPTGPTGASGSVTVYPFTNAATWTIRHNLGRFPIVQLVDATGAAFGSDVEMPDLNTAVVTLAAPTSGSALVS